MVHKRTRRTSGWTRIGAVLASSTILAATLVAVAVSPAGAQKSGGDLRFGLEAETTGGFCLNQAQLVTSGKQIAAALYDTLCAQTGSPVVALNRAVAVAEVDGPEAGLALLDGLDLAHYRYFHSARADLLRRAGRADEARRAYQRALDLVQTDAERRSLEAQLARLAPPG